MNEWEILNLMRLFDVWLQRAFIEDAIHLRLNQKMLISNIEKQINLWCNHVFINGAFFCGKRLAFCWHKLPTCLIVTWNIWCIIWRFSILVFFSSFWENKRSVWNNAVWCHFKILGLAHATGLRLIHFLSTSFFG